MEVPELVRSPVEVPTEPTTIPPEFELRPDHTPRLTLPPDEPEPEYSEEQLEYKRKKEKATRCKIIMMDELNIPLTTNTTFCSKAEKFLLLKGLERWFEKPDEEVRKTFNDICSSKMLDFQNPETNYEKYAVYKTRIPD